MQQFRELYIAGDAGSTWDYLLAFSLRFSWLQICSWLLGDGRVYLRVFGWATCERLFAAVRSHMQLEPNIGAPVRWNQAGACGTDTELK